MDALLFALSAEQTYLPAGPLRRIEASRQGSFEWGKLKQGLSFAL